MTRGRSTGSARVGSRDGASAAGRRRRLRRGLTVCVGALAFPALAFGILSAAFPFPRAKLAAARATGSVLVLDREGGVIAWRAGAAGGGSASDVFHLPVKIGEVSPWLVNATMAAEDRRFGRHPGVDPFAVLRAAKQNVTSGRRVSGASTITMQVVRLVTPRPRTYAAKCVEAFRALELERIASKRQVLELYLSLAPYGGNVVGAEAASVRYFGKRAADLTLGEAALLAGVPQSPARFNPLRHLDAALGRREYVFERMRALGLADGEEIVTAKRERIVTLRPGGTARTPGRTHAPRFADYVLSLRGRAGGVVRTTLDPDVQDVTSRAVRRRAAELARLGIDGAAVVVVDVGRSELLAMVGSLDPSDPLVGCVNCAVSRRQPGSLLKPFIYAAAFGSGELTPQSVVFDVPISRRGYRPRNMDRRFLGPVSAARALSESRNVPAVRLLQRIGVARLARDMNMLGLGVAAAEERCGLSLALGTAEVRLVDIANAYATLARLGEYRPLGVLDGEGLRNCGDTTLRLLAGSRRQGGAGRSPQCGTVGSPQSPGQAERVYSRGAAYLVLRALGASGRARRGPPAWKTGTSWDHRDAWAVAMTPARVVAVWCGTLSGSGRPALVGGRAALPLALEILQRVDRLRASAPEDGKPCWEPPPDVRTRRVCSVSGAPATASCGHTTEAEYLAGVTTEAPCAIHRAAGSGEARRVVTVWPSDVAAWLSSEEAGACGSGPPRIDIVSPTEGGEYVIARGHAASADLYFAARAPAGCASVYWYLDGELLRRAPPGEAVRWPMVAGRHELIAADGRGASARARFRVTRLARRALAAR